MQLHFFQASNNSRIAVTNNNKITRPIADNVPNLGTGEPSTWDVIFTTPGTTITPTGIAPPPPTQINKLQIGTTGLRKDKRRSSSRFNISSNRELHKLPYLKGECVIFLFLYAG